MDAISWFCAHCGADNEEQQQNCFACQQPRLLENRYQLLTQVGSGGFGAVYRALDTQEGQRLVALKQIVLRGLSPSEMIEATDAYHREVRLLSALRHPGLPRLHRHFGDRDNWYLVMDFVQGETLEHYLAQRAVIKPLGEPLLPLDEVVRIGLQLCDILAYLHTRQPAIIFRDLKPSNIMRASHERLFLIDFGTARHYRPGLIKDTIPLGSPGYAAPEQYGRAQTTPRSDIYSLGALLHHLLSGYDPADSPFRFEPLRTVADPTKKQLATLVAQMVELEAEKRPARIGEVERELRTLQDRLQGRTATEPLRAYPIQQPPRPYSSSKGYAPAWSTWPGSLQTQGSGQQQQQIYRHASSRVKKASLAGRRAALALLGLVAMGALGNALTAAHNPQNYRAFNDEDTRSMPPRNQRSSENSGITALTWSANGTRLAMSDTDDNLHVFAINHQRSTGTMGTIALGQAIFTQSGEQSTIGPLALSPDGLQFAACIAERLHIWNLTTQQELSVPIPPIGLIMAMAWSDDGQRLAFTGESRIGYVWDLATSQPILDLAGQSINQSPPIWSPNGRYLLLPDNTINTLQLWDVEKKQLLQRYHSDIGLTAWSPDSMYLTTRDDTAQIVVYNATQGTAAFTLEHPQLDGSYTAPQTLSWSPGGRNIAALYGENLTIWQGTSPDYQLISSEQLPYSDLANSLAWSSDGQILAWSSDGQMLLIVQDAETIITRFLV